MQETGTHDFGFAAAFAVSKEVRRYKSA
jgi:hypothetical protein